MWEHLTQPCLCRFLPRSGAPVWFALYGMWWKSPWTGSWEVWLQALPHVYSCVTSSAFRDVSCVMSMV